MECASIPCGFQEQCEKGNFPYLLLLIMYDINSNLNNYVSPSGFELAT